MKRNRPKKTARISQRVEPWHYEGLEEVADQQGKTLAICLREAIAVYVRNHQNQKPLAS